MDQNIKTAENLSEYIEAVEFLWKEVDSELPPRRMYYRGQANSEYKLIPSLARQLGGCCNLEPGFERRIVEYVEESFPEVFREIRTPIDRLAFLQHHGAPTRLLDITSSPLVALFFAVTDGPDVDGEVIVFTPVDKESERYPMDMAIADSYRMVRGSADSLELFYNRVKVQDYFLEQRDLAENYVDKMVGGANWVYECCKQPLFVHSFHHSMRQKVQQSSFILFPNEIRIEENGNKCFIENIKPLEKDSDAIAARIQVPASVKQRVVAELEHAGISKAALFADSIDVVCQEAGKYAKQHAFYADGAY